MAAQQNLLTLKIKLINIYKYDLKVISKESGAIGAAQIARDVYNGKDNILGIEVDLS